MGYVIAHQRPDDAVGGQVRLNPTLLATIFGEPVKRIQEAIDYLCSPDPRSTTPDEEGRRLVKIGQFDYRVVNAAKYLAIRNEEERREANRIRQAAHRSKKKPKAKKRDLARVQAANDSRQERHAVMEANGNPEAAEKIAAEDLPNGTQSGVSDGGV
jgi:hypothetical protein